MLHPYSGASKPMPDWDSIPSRPLPFAATLHDLDLNAQPSASLPAPKIPRPKRHQPDDFPPAFPTPVYGHARHGSVSSPTPVGRGLLGSPSPYKAVVGSDDWMQMRVAHCVDNAKCDLVLSDFGLERLSTRIADLGDLVTLPTAQSPTASPSARLSRAMANQSPSLNAAIAGPSSRALALGERSFSRTQSAPASAAFFSSLRQSPTSNLSNRSSLLPALPLAPFGALGATEVANDDSDSPVQTPDSPSLTGSPNMRRRFGRSKTGAVDFSKRAAPSIGVYLSQNRLTRLPSALFEIRYITVLSLRNNQLQSLPAAIGGLVHLKELNISNNRIEYLPSTILNLSLEQFSAHPNRWLQPPTDAEPHEDTSRVLSPIRSLCLNNERVSSVPRLTSLCMNVLISPRPPDNLPPLINYDWDACGRGANNPLLDANSLSGCMPFVPVHDATRVLQAVKSACTAASRGSDGGRGSRRVNPYPRSHLTPEPDDASANPYYYACPCPRHQEWDEHSPQPLDRPIRRVFLHAAEERFEWLEVAKTPDLPIKWLGCAPGCLAFLDTDQDEWQLDSDEFDN